MFTSNNLSIIDETGRSDVMAATVPATNKWLLTKQASVAQSAEQWQARDGFLSEPCGRRASLTHEQMEAAWKGKERLPKCGKRWRQAEEESKRMSKPWARLRAWVSVNAWAVQKCHWTRALGSRCLLAFTTHTAGCPTGQPGASDTKVDAWNPRCPDPPTERHPLVLHLTLRIPFLPLCIS